MEKVDSMMRRALFRLSLLLALISTLSAAALAQSASTPPSTAPGIVPDDMLTLVVGTRFVPAPTGADTPSAHALFTHARVPLASFNETDHCIDQAALEVAQEYFTALGRLLGKAGHYYFLPDDAVAKSALMCERLHHTPPQAWNASKTKILAIGRVVPTAEAPALERTLR